MVGEIRDVETADIAIRAAMTGHLVFSTLHTNDAVGGITRLIDMEVEPFLLASVVKAFLAQRLVRTICPDCVETVDYPKDYLEEIAFPIERGTIFKHGAGCENCRQTGYQGRLAIYEICLVTEPLKRLIMKKADGGELKQCAITQGMLTLRQDGWRRVLEGKTTIEEVVSGNANRRSHGRDHRLRRAGHRRLNLLSRCSFHGRPAPISRCKGTTRRSKAITWAGIR